VDGKYEKLFTRVANIQKKSGQFDVRDALIITFSLSIFLQMLLCVGTFFASGDECKSQWKQVVDGTIPGVCVWACVLPCVSASMYVCVCVCIVQYIEYNTVRCVCTCIIFYSDCPSVCVLAVYKLTCHTHHNNFLCVWLLYM